MLTKKYLQKQKQHFYKIIYGVLATLGSIFVFNYFVLDGEYMAVYVLLFMASCLSMIFYFNKFFAFTACPDCNQSLKLHKQATNQNMFYDCLRCQVRWQSHIKLGESDNTLD